MFFYVKYNTIGTEDFSFAAQIISDFDALPVPSHIPIEHNTLESSKNIPDMSPVDIESKGTRVGCVGSLDTSRRKGFLF